MQDTEQEILDAFSKSGIGVEGMEPQEPQATNEVVENNPSQVVDSGIETPPETPPQQEDVINNQEHTDGDATNVEGTQEVPPQENVETFEFTQEQQNHLNSTIDEMSGGVFQSFEDFQNSDVFDVYEQNNQLVEQLEALQQEEKMSPYANDLVKSLNDYMEGGGQDVNMFFRLNSLNVDEVSDLDAVKHQLQIQNPGLNKDQLNAHLKSTYHQYDSEDIEYDESLAATAAVNLNIAANQAREYLRNEQSSVSYPSAEERIDNYAKLENERIDAWVEPMDNAINSLSSINIPLGDGIDFDYQIPQESLNGLYQELQQVVETSGIAAGENVNEHAAEIVKNHIVATQFESISKAIHQNAKRLADEEWQSKAHNPSALKPEPGVSSNEPTSDAEGIKNMIESIMSVDG
jgi:hypothetical protein